MQLNKTKLNISVALAVIDDLGGKVFNISAHSCPLVVQPSLFPDKPAIPRNLFMRNKANFNYPNIIATSYNTVAYNTFQANPKNETNPIKANFVENPIYFPTHIYYYK